MFIILSGLGAVWTWIFIIETKQIPLEEMGAIFGDEVAVRAADVHVDHNTHELIVNEHTAKGEDLARVVSEGDALCTDVNEVQGDKTTANCVGDAQLIERVPFDNDRA